MKVTIAPDFRDLFRPMTDEEFEQAKANNQADPNHERIPPVVVWDGIIIDGHHTHRIRENLRDREGRPVKIRYAKMEFPDRQAAMAYAIHAQIGRRNLDASQIAMAIAKLPKGTPGRPTEKNGSKFATISSGPSRDELAEEAGVSRRTVQNADKVTEQGAKSVQAAVIAGDVSVSDAAAIVDLPKDEQAKAVKAVKSGKAKTLKAAAGKAKAYKENPDADPAPDAPVPQPSVVLDCFDRPIPNQHKAAHELAALIASQARRLDPILRELLSMADQRGGEFIPRAPLEIAIKQLKGEILGACYAFECPRCEGLIGKPCKACGGKGFWPMEKKGKLSAADKAYLGID